MLWRESDKSIWKIVTGNMRSKGHANGPASMDGIGLLEKVTFELQSR